MSSPVVEAIYAKYGNRTAGISAIETISIAPELSVSLRRVKKPDGTLEYFLMTGSEAGVSLGTAERDTVSAPQFSAALTNGRPYLSPLLIACGKFAMAAQLLGKPIQAEPLDSIAVPNGRVFLLPVIGATGQPGNDFELLAKIENRPNFGSDVIPGAVLAQSVATGESGLKAALLAVPEFVRKLAPVNAQILSIQESGDLKDDLPITQTPQPVVPKPHKGL